MEAMNGGGVLLHFGVFCRNYLTLASQCVILFPQWEQGRMVVFGNILGEVSAFDCSRDDNTD